MTAAARLALSDPIYGRIARFVPRGVDQNLREDIISDVYLAIREGRLHPRNIEAEARRFINAAFGAFANRWGALSLDALIADEGATFLDMLPDPAALEAFERIEFRETRNG